MNRKQKIWLNNTLLAACGGVMLTLLMGYAQISGRTLASDITVIILLSAFWVVSLFVIFLIASGISQRFADGSMTILQTAWAINTTLIFMTLSTAPSEPYYFLLLITMIFGVFRLTTQQFIYVALYIVSALAMQKITLIFLLGQALPWVDIALNWGVFSFTMVVLVSLNKSTTILRKRLKDRNTTLQEALATKNMFLANMSHELRTPINGIMGMLTLLEKSPLTEQQRRHSRLAQSSSLSLLAIVNDILDFSKIDAGKLDIEHVEFNLLQLLEEMAETISHDVIDKPVDVVADFTDVSHTTVYSDPVRIRQIITNLARNSAKFTEAGEIFIHAKLEKNDEQQTIFTCAIHDTGIGISAEKHNTIFESFSQADISTTREYGGTGLGLAIVKKLCDLLEGDISLASQEGQGSIFTVQLPINVVTQKPASPHIDLVDKTFMIVDDKPSSRNAITRQLRSWGAHILAADTLELAAQQLEGSDNGIVNGLFIDWPANCKPLLHTAQTIGNYVSQNHCACVLMSPTGLMLEDPILIELNLSANLAKPALPTNVYNALTCPENPLIHQVVQPKTDTLNTQINRQGVATDIKVLLVEDNPINQEVAAGLLESLYLECEIATNGKDAIDILSCQQSNFAFILMDCQMPEMDGYDASKAIRAGEAGTHNSDIPIIAMTANAMKGDREKCLKAGMNDYITKPIETDIFEEKIHYWLAKSLADTALQERVTISAERDYSEQDPADDQTWDKASALRRVNGKSERLKRLSTLYLTCADEDFSRLEQAIAAQDIGEIRLIAHGIKGVTGNLGAISMMNTMQKIETAAKENDYQTIANLRQETNEKKLALEQCLTAFTEQD